MSTLGPAPVGHVLYRLYDVSGDLLYVGITYALSSRLRHHERHQPWWREVATCTWERWPPGPHLRIAEWQAIRREQPRHNTPTVWPMCVPRELAAEYVHDLLGTAP